jgi:glycerophosphodiester phosphodiesterase
VPVVYHDFLVSETGTDAWMYNLSFSQVSPIFNTCSWKLIYKIAQFMHISDAQSRPVQRRSERLAGLRPRSRSLNVDEDHRVADLKERFEHTFEFGLKQFKANTRGDYIHEPFITLDKLLATLPESCPLNIEISKTAPLII